MLAVTMGIPNSLYERVKAFAWKCLEFGRAVDEYEYRDSVMGMEEESAQYITDSVIEDSCEDVCSELIAYIMEGAEDDTARQAYNLLRELRWLREQISDNS